MSIDMPWVKVRGYFNDSQIWPKNTAFKEEMGFGSNGGVISYSEFIDRLPPMRYFNNETKVWEEMTIYELESQSPGSIDDMCQFYAAAMFGRCGNRLFSVGPHLMDRISETDKPDLSVPTPLRLPFDAIYVRTPRMPVKISAKDGDGVDVEEEIHGFYAIMRWDGERRHGLGDDVVEKAYVECTLLSDNGGSVPRPTIFALGVNEDCELVRDNVEYRSSVPEGRGITDEDRMYDILINTLLYISSPRADMSEPIISRNTRRLANAEGKSEKWLQKMNRRVACDPITIRVGDNVRPLGGVGTAGWHYSKRFMRRGHWRRQPCGKGRKDRCLRWIEPYWVGPTLGDRIHGRQYDVVVGGEL